MPQPQGLRRHALCRIDVNGQDVTNIINPYLISVRVTITTQGEFSRADIELDDRNAELAIPPKGSPVSVYLGWSSTGPNIRPAQEVPAGSEAALPYESSGAFVVFNGKVYEAESGFARTGGGRRLWVTAIAPDPQGKGKSKNLKTWGEGSVDDQQGEGSESLGSVLSGAFKGTGVNVAVHPQLSKITRNFWHMNESPFNLVRRLAKEVGGKIRSDPTNGNNIIVEPHDAYPEGTVEAVWGYNLIAWRIKPFIPRPQWSQGKSDYFNVIPGSWKDTIKSFTNAMPFGGEGTGGFGSPEAVPNKSVGDQTNDGSEAQSQANEAQGWVIMNGEPAARCSGRVSIQGARPGVDAVWGIVEVEHQYSRRGFTTRCDVNHPDGLAPAYRGQGWDLKNPTGGQRSSTPHQVDPRDVQPQQETPSTPTSSAADTEVST